MQILVTNDDGINAIGIRKLAESLKKIGKVTVVAPDRQRSAIGHAITLHKPLRVDRFEFNDIEIDAWSINGTPSDCVKIAVESILEKKPDVVVSGINDGPNLGTDVLYSGTVSAAIEGAIHNIPSIAISAVGSKEKINYEGAKIYSCKLVKSIIEKDIPNNIIFNINIPALYIEKIKGIKVTELGIRKYKNNYIKRKDPMGKSYYWLAGKLIEIENNKESDVMATESGYISITPLHFNLTNYDFLDEMKNWEL
ncbi:5'/3'-nucleotidase SurE [Thermohalobacter berrensis]|uniref:5'-nucleotidase SurE n=1 Tax=Thermohalobacter berrensis TaxID=99594 RepID=A0A419TAQ3_9FIRM|nr:5'/3'-nucleotidase SurE [Thermohalobacter berrensis]RKD34532.1 5'/3'-nucleotidase SurE [Thermohalobacter berrensis]